MITEKELKDGKVIVKKNFLSQTEAVDMWYFANTCAWRYKEVTNAHFAPGQKRMTSAFDINVFVETDLWHKIEKLFEVKLSLRAAYISYLDHASVSVPHCDGDGSGPSILICLNREWKKDWCGYTTVFEHMNSNDVIHTSVPEPGKATIFSGQLWHSGLPVTHYADYPRLMLTVHTSLEGSPNV
jgi:hypothetical protein